MIQPALAVLGRTNSRGPIGYRVIDVHGREVIAFTRAGAVGAIDKFLAQAEGR